VGTVFEFVQVFGIFGNCKGIASGDRGSIAVESGSIDAVLGSAAAADTTRLRVEVWRQSTSQAD
jgi:hypothetical protein